MFMFVCRAALFRASFLGVVILVLIYERILGQFESPNPIYVCWSQIGNQVNIYLQSIMISFCWACLVKLRKGTIIIIIRARQPRITLKF